MSELRHLALRRMRAETGLTQAQFADKLGLTQSGVSKIENGSRLPARATLEAWVAACGKSMEIAGVSELSEGEQAVLSAAATVDPDDLHLVAEALRGLATVRGRDREMARSTLQWLAERAPPLVEGDAELPPTSSVPAETTTRVRK